MQDGRVKVTFSDGHSFHVDASVGRILDLQTLAKMPAKEACRHIQDLAESKHVLLNGKTSEALDRLPKTNLFQHVRVAVTTRNVPNIKYMTVDAGTSFATIHIQCVDKKNVTHYVKVTLEANYAWADNSNGFMDPDITVLEYEAPTIHTFYLASLRQILRHVCNKSAALEPTPFAQQTAWIRTMHVKSKK